MEREGESMGRKEGERERGRGGRKEGRRESEGGGRGKREGKIGGRECV